MKAIQNFYENAVALWKKELPDSLEPCTLEIGLAIKHARLRMGMSQDELALQSKIKNSALKTLENGYARFTSLENLLAISRILKTPLSSLLDEARECADGNFFVLKNQTFPKKKDPDSKIRQTAYGARTLQIESANIRLFTPPFEGPSHFHLMVMELGAGKKIGPLKQKSPSQVTGFVTHGTISIQYQNQPAVDIYGNQGFTLDAGHPHTLTNPDPHNPARIWLVFSLTPDEPNPLSSETPLSAPHTNPPFSTGRLIQTLRKIYSPSKDRLLSFEALAGLTGLDSKSLQYLEKTVSLHQVVYWDKIEKIAQTLRIPFSKLVAWGEGKSPGYFYTSTSYDRALIDYRHYLGVKIKSVLFPGTHNQFHVSEVYIDPRGGIRRPSWKRHDDARMAAVVEDGEILVESGKNRKTLLKTGESVYFDGALGYMFTNLGQGPCKLILATSPAVIF